MVFTGNGKGKTTAAFGKCCLQLVKACQRMRNWLFHQNRATRQRRRNGDIQMHGRGVGNYNSLGLVCQRSLDGGFNRNVGNFIVRQGGAVRAQEQ